MLLKQVCNVLLIRRPKLHLRCLSQIATEVVAYDDAAIFPPEKGIIKRSIYASRLEIPKCTIDQYVWENVSQWSDKPAVVSLRDLNRMKIVLTHCLLILGLWYHRSVSHLRPGTRSLRRLGTKTSPLTRF